MCPKKTKKNETKLDARIDDEFINEIYAHRVSTFSSKISSQPSDEKPLVSSAAKPAPVVLSIPMFPILILSDNTSLRLKLSREIAEGNFQILDCSYENLLSEETPQFPDFSLFILDTDHCNGSLPLVFTRLNRLYANHPVILYGKNYPDSLNRSNRPRYFLGGISDARHEVPVSEESESDAPARNSETLFSLIQSGLAIYKKLRENEVLLHSQGIPVVPFHLGKTSGSPVAETLWNEILRYGKESDSAVFLQTEWGTRTDLVASQIHLNSSRKDSAFDIVPLDMINGEFLELYLFGIEPGTHGLFPQGYIGRIEMMNHGTLFLSNIDYLSYTIHERLLAYMQNNSLYRVGAKEPTICDTRIISSAPAFIEALVKEGTFPEELFTLLSERIILVPEFRKLKDDLPAMTLMAAEWVSQRARKPTPVFEPEAIEKIKRYSWPLNTIEYEHMIRRVILSNKTGRVTAEDIVFDMALSTKKARISSLSGITFEEIEREVIFETLQANEGNRAATAKSLGISEKTLYNKLKEYEKDK